jgi:sulfotransferase
MVQKIFFQSSLPRAGSTLLQNIIGQNPDFYVTPTSGVLELVFAARSNYTDSFEFKAQDQDVMREGFRGFCRSGVEGFFNSITDKPYVLDKSRGWGYYQDFLNFFYPNPKIICMVRDPRAIFSSMEKNYRKNPDKAQKLTSDVNMSGITTEQRIDIWAQGQPIGLAFQRLFQIVKEGNDKNMLFIKYENLTTNPQRELDKIYNYLELDSYKHDFTNIEQITKEDDEVYGIFGDHKIRSTIESTTSDWNTILGVNASTWIVNNYKWFYDYFSYRI